MNPYSYQWHEMAQLALAPARAMSGITKLWFTNPANPFAHTHIGRNVAASAEMFERLTRRYGKPAFGIDQVKIDGKSVPVHETVIWERTFCRLLHFEREIKPNGKTQPKLLLIAPMSGHYATLLRGTVETFLPYYDVYITDWEDARMVPIGLGRFGLDDYIEYVIEICRLLSADYDGIPLHTIAVCQPAVPLFAAVSIMEARNDPHIPASMTLMGGPIDTRRSPTTVNILAETRGSDWFRDNCIYAVPYPYPGASRNVYPGFLQLSGFMAMNIDRHVNAHIEMFNHLVDEDGDSAERHREFYDEYLSVMDLDAEFYLQTVDAVFVEHRLPMGTMRYREKRVDPSAIHRVALMTVEGENDDISGVGQTQAAHDLCPNLPAKLKLHYMQKNVGHYGVFNGSRFREQIAPRIRAFHAQVTQVQPEPVPLSLS
ncbi:MAG: polyhydroxyalkanoate depolymerase [Beijerinckiaceae bacterium]|nr:MAG: polyhydroxyalkanoate depolymerase [Beijerinckiaceae bacterium]